MALSSWLEGESVTLLNDRNICTRVDPATGKGSLLDVGITSKNISKAVTNFEVDTDKKWTPFSMSKNAQKTILKKFTDHRSFSFNVTLPCILTNNKKKPIINFKNPEGWENYKKVSDAHAQSIREVIDNTTDTKELRIKINIINMEIQVKSVGITWEGPSKQKKLVKRDSKEIK